MDDAGRRDEHVGRIDSNVELGNFPTDVRRDGPDVNPGKYHSANWPRSGTFD